MHSQESHSTGTVLVVAVGLIVLTTNILLPTLVGVYVDHFGLTIRDAGYSAAVYMTGGGVGAVLVGWRIFTTRTPVLLAGALVALIVGNVASIGMHTLHSILVVRLLAGIGEGAGFALMGVGVSRMENPSRVYAVFQVLLLVLAAGIQYSIPWLRRAFGAQMLFVPIALGPACLLFFAHRFPDLRGRSQVAHGALGGTTLDHVRGHLWCGALATLAAYIAYGATFAYIERVGVWAGVPADRVSRLLGAGYFVGIGGAALALVTAKWRGGTYAVVGSLIVVMLSTFLAVQNTPRAYQVGVAMLFFSWFYFAPNLLGLLSLADPTGRLTALSTGAEEWGIAIGPAVVAPWVHEGSQGYLAWTGLIGYALATSLLWPVARKASGDRRFAGGNPRGREVTM